MLASIRAVSTRMVVFDTAVVDLTEDLHDPVDLLFGTQLGGGTDINRALAYCQQIITRPAQTILVLITDLYEGGNARGDAAARGGARRRAACRWSACWRSTTRARPASTSATRRRSPALGIPSFACTPDLFPDLMAAAIQKRDLALWAARNDIVAARAAE